MEELAGWWMTYAGAYPDRTMQQMMVATDGLRQASLREVGLRSDTRMRNPTPVKMI